MNSKTKNIIQTILFTVVLLGIALFCWLKPDTDYSESERRDLKKLPELTVRTLLSGDFMSKFEDYTLDQFPLRDTFRTIKAVSNNYVFGRLDNNDIFVDVDGYISKIEYPLDYKGVETVQKKFRYIYESYLKDNNTNIYLSIIPDKSSFTAQKSDRLYMDYEEFYRVMTKGVEYAEYIDITDLLSIEDYYLTDTHWKQECITDVADLLAKKMGTKLTGDYVTNTLDKDFYGVYYGQAALPHDPETIKYLTNEVINNCIVNDLQNGKLMSMYDMEKAYGKDPYEMFLSGSLSLITIENPNANNERELVVFRDSFGSSLVPLLSSGYKKITVVDIRYIPSMLVGDYVDFNNKDVLFIYSTLVLNSGSSTLK